MADVLSELKNLSEILQNQKTTLLKAHEIIKIYIKHIKSLSTYPGQHAAEASQASHAQFIQAVAESMKERLFTTTADRAQAQA